MVATLRDVKISFNTNFKASALSALGPPNRPNHRQRLPKAGFHSKANDLTVSNYHAIQSSVSHPKKILFVCSHNRWRSLTAERMYDGFPGYEVRSVGTEPGARIRVTEGHIGWADWIFVMEKKHVEKLRNKFDEALVGKRIICLHIPDDYACGDPELIALLKAKLSEYVEVPG